jgi:zinc protease
MKVRRPLLLLAALGIPALAVADNVPRPKLELNVKPYDLKYVDYPFPSGFRILFQRDDSQPVVSLSMVVDNGSTSDPAGKEGIAHLVEHMWFRSVHKDASGQNLPKVWDLLRDMGAEINAYTAEDLTNFMEVAPKDKLVPLLRLESLRMREPVAGVTEDVLLIEREVVRNELRLNYENGSGDAFRYMYQKLFPPGYAYANLGIGTHDSLNAIALADIQQFCKENYGPQFSTLLVVGDIDMSKTNEYLNEFGIDQLADPKNPTGEIALVEPKPRVTGPSAEPPPPYQPVLVKGETVGITTEHAAVQKPSVVLGWTVPGGYRPDQAMMSIAANQLTYAIYQSLNPSWKIESGDAINNLGCWFDGKVGVSLVACYIELGKGEAGLDIPEKALDGLQNMWTTDEAYRQFQNFLFSRAKVESMASVFRTVDLFASLFTTRVSEAANFIHYTGNARYFDAQFQALNGVKADEARKFAEKYLNRNRAVAVIIQPYEEGDINTEGTDSQYRGERRDDVLTSVLNEAMLTPQVIEDALIPPDITKLSETKLPNGLKVVVMPHSNAPLVRIALSFEGGTKSSTLAPYANAAYTVRGSADPLRIAGIQGFSASSFRTQFLLDASAGNLPDALYILRDDIDNFYADTNGSIDWAKQKKKDLIADQGDPASWAAWLRADHTFPNHPMSHRLTHADFDALRGTPLAQVDAYWSQVLQPTNATLYIVGNITADEAKKAAATYFGGWAGHKKPPEAAPALLKEWPPATPPLPRKVYIVDKKIASQSPVDFQCQLTAVNASNLASAQVLGDVLSISTWLALREQTGASYGAYAWAAPTSNGGPASLNMWGSIQNDQTPLAVKTFLDIAKQAADGKLDVKTMALQKYGRASKYVTDHQSTEQMLQRLMGLFEQGYDASFFSAYAKQLANVSNATIAPLLKPCIGNEVITVTGPKDVLAPLFDKAGITYEVFDWEQAKKDYATKFGLKSAKDDKKDDKKK